MCTPMWSRDQQTMQTCLSGCQDTICRKEVRVSGTIRRGDYHPVPGERMEIVMRMSSAAAYTRPLFSST
jgi:hypothetical protein